MASRKGSKASRKRPKRGPGKKGSGNQKLVVFAFVMAVVGFAVWHNSPTVPTRPSQPVPAVRPAQPLRPSVPSRPSEAAKPRKTQAAVKPAKPAAAPKSAEPTKKVPVAKPSGAVKQVSVPKAAEAAKPAESAKAKQPARQSGFFGFFFRPADLDSKTAGAFRKFGLTKETLVRRLSVEKQLGDMKYFRTYAEYEVPGSFVWKDFQPALARALQGSPFRVNSAGRRTKAGRDVYTLSINRDDLIVMRLEIRLKKTAAPAPVVLPHKRPRVAIVIDDFGYSMNNIETFLGIGEPLTFAVLPRQPYSTRVAALARARGFEVILHLPLESRHSDVGEEADTIRSGMSEGEIEAMLARELADVPGAVGVNNHQGSKGTEDPKLMSVILRYLKGRGLFFLDSLTSPKSVCRDVASSVGVRYARRTKFLDNDNDPAAIEEQLNELKAAAMVSGKAIAICHDRKNTAAVLARMMPDMAGEGIEFVYLSEMER